MKALNILDLIVQTFILGLVTLVSVGILAMGSFESVAWVAMYGAIFLGPWQLISSIATCIARGLYFKLRLIHLLTSVGYILTASLLVAFAHGVDFPGWAEVAGGIIGFTVPVLLAVFYYVITVRTFMLARANAKTIEVTA